MAMNDAGSHMSGAERIAAERQRQVEVEGWTADHDDAISDDEHYGHVEGALAKAALCYAEAGQIAARADEENANLRRYMERHGMDPDTDKDFQQRLENAPRHYYGWHKAPKDWPWAASWWKPSPDPIRNFEKAGALIAAEIDRLLRRHS